MAAHWKVLCDCVTKEEVCYKPTITVIVADATRTGRSDEPGAWYEMLPLEMVYAFDPIPPEPEMLATPMSRSSMSDLQVEKPPPPPLPPSPPKTSL